MSDMLTPERVEAIRERHRATLWQDARWPLDQELVREDIAALLADHDALTAEVDHLHGEGRESTAFRETWELHRATKARAEAAERKVAEAAEQRDAMFDRLNAVLYLAQNPDGRIRRRTFVWADRITRWAPPNRALDGEAD